jgi:streptomycin 6-kinase
LGTPFEGVEVSCAWVAPAVRDDGTAAVLKLAMPHFEGEHEIQGLRFWDGDPTVRLLEADEDASAMLLERCEPGTHLRELPELEQDQVVAGLLRRLWRRPPARHSFRPLSALMAYWSAETLSQSGSWPDEGLVREGLRLLQELSLNAPAEVLLATDLHAGNVLAAQREPWLVIDPKPFVGDPAYDATQHLLNCRERLLRDPKGTIGRFADLLQVDSDRMRLWTFARATAEPREAWDDDGIGRAHALAP